MKTFLSILFLSFCAATNAQIPTQYLFYNGSIDQFGYVKSWLKSVPSTEQDKEKKMYDLIASATEKKSNYLLEYQAASSIAFSIRKPHVVRDAIAHRIETLVPEMVSVDQLKVIDSELWLAYAYSHLLTSRRKVEDSQYRPSENKYKAQHFYRDIVWRATYSENFSITLKSVVAYLYGDVRFARHCIAKLPDSELSTLNISLLKFRFDASKTANAPADYSELEQRAVKLANKFPNSGRMAILAAQLTSHTNPNLSKAFAQRTIDSTDALPYEKQAAKRLL